MQEQVLAYTGRLSRRLHVSTEMVRGGGPAGPGVAVRGAGAGCGRPALHRGGDAEAQACVGSEPVAGRPAGRVRDDRRQPGREHPGEPPLAGAGGGRRAGFDCQVREGRGHAALVPGRPAPRVHLDAGRQFTGLDGGDGSRRSGRCAAQDHQPRHGGVGHRLVAGRQVAGVCVRRLPRLHDERVQRAGAREVRGPPEPRACVRRPDVPALGFVEGRAVQPPVPGSLRRFRGAARPHAGRGGRAAVLARRPRRLRLLAGFARARLHAEDGPGRSDQHEQRSLPAGSRQPIGPAAEDHDEPGGGRGAFLLARRTVHRLSRPAAGRLRGGPLAVDAVRPEERRASLDDRRVRPFARQLRVVGRLEHDLSDGRERRPQRHLPPVAGGRRPQAGPRGGDQRGTATLARRQDPRVHPDHARVAGGPVQGDAGR